MNKKISTLPPFLFVGLCFLEFPGGFNALVSFKGLLQLEGELPPILASLVKNDKYVNGMLDTTADVSLKMLQ